MYKFDEQKKINDVAGALALRPQIEKLADEICKEGYDLICFIGIGGTYASALQVENHMKMMSSIPVCVEEAAQFLTTGNRRVTEKTLVVFSSVTGSTQEMVDAVAKIKERGIRVFGFLDVEGTKMEKSCDYCVIYPQNEQLKFFMLADRLMYNAGEFPEYSECYANFEKHLPKALADVEKQADEFAQDFVAKHHDDKLHYFVAAGTQYGATYSYAMCYWEEMHWMRTKSIHSAEFFHGMLEIVERDTAVTVYVGEDAERPLSERVAKFLPSICGRYTVIDSADYKLPGIEPRFRQYLSHLVTHAVNNRIDVHLEQVNCHPMDIRRYYRRLEY